VSLLAETEHAAGWMRTVLVRIALLAWRVKTVPAAIAAAKSKPGTNRFPRSDPVRQSERSPVSPSDKFFEDGRNSFRGTLPGTIERFSACEFLPGQQQAPVGHPPGDFGDLWKI
jgi:hypothetical protein